MSEVFAVGDWCRHRRHRTPCRIIDRQSLWNETVFRVWLPTKDAIIRARASDLAPLASLEPTENEILHTAAAAKLLDALEDNLLLAPIQSSVVPLPHQLHALNKAMSGERIRYLLADEVGLGKTIEAGLILRELKLRGMVRRVLVLAPKSLVRQWQAEMHLHFGEAFRLIEPAELAALRSFVSSTVPGDRSGSGERDDNLWLMHDQVICSIDSVKPLEGRRGWSLERLATYNRERFEDLVAASWDLVIVDESHRLGGSTEQVARYKLGAALAEAAPYLLLLSATPHQGKTDHFLRLIQLLDREAFPDEGSITRDRVRPFVIRTEKLEAIDAEGQPLFKPRMTRLQAVTWQPRHAAQQRLYESVTDYVRHGYNQAMAAQQRHIGFLMILMQRLVTSSTAAIRATLEKRLEALNRPSPQASLFDELISPDADPEQWAELDGQSQADMAVQTAAQTANWTLDGLAREKVEVEMLLALARETEAAGTDAKAEALLELIYGLQQAESDPALKVLVFTEFVPTQRMLADYLEGRGFTIALLNGSMDLDARTQAQLVFSQDAQILISTDAGGEGLNLQFCHVVVNFDMPWNPMRIEQRIGRVDRIGQQHVVRATNFVLDETVEYRVRQVLEEKLTLIAKEFGVDKAADVMDSVEAEPWFDELFVKGITDPESVDQQCDAVVTQIREKVAESYQGSDLITEEPSAGQRFSAEEARQWRDHPAQFWLERTITTGLPARGGEAVQEGDHWRIRWLDGSESARACFDARTAEARPELEWITLEDARARALIAELPRCVAGQPMPRVRISGLPETVTGIWSLWEISLCADRFSRKRFLPIFVNDDGRAFLPTARRIWDLLLTERLELVEALTPADSLHWEPSLAAATGQGEPHIQALMELHRTRLQAARERACYAFEARDQAIGRIGLPAVRAYRRRRLEQEHKERMATLDAAETSLPDLSAIMMLRVGPGFTSDSGAAGSA
ncbi:helicase-related protein [Lamprobacter modestohalophilus]|uniref:DEAD/DEAH box helicase n=1 Tax=Lamprobacter modestohalophilus TaxID=1064514 RepID=UPI002ADEBD5C|nr:helicase-related protein [Lamprobacter modestohalophilus]MEA1051892.1 helicase-related protein [Lamprobacter modestohalophilus]